MSDGGTLPILTDDVVATSLEATDAVRWVAEAVVATHHASVGPGRVVFTVGSSQEGWFGYRSYDTWGTDSHQLVVLHDGSTGHLRAVSVGSLLGQLRTGGLAGTEVFMPQRLAARWGAAAEAGSVGRALDTTHIEQQRK